MTGIDPTSDSLMATPDVGGGSDGADASNARKPVVQARALRTRAKILEQARTAFAKLGFDATSLTSDILKPADVSVGSFYHQFDNKQQVLVALMQEGLVARRKRVAELTIRAADSSLRDALETSLVALLDDADVAPELWQIQYREQEHPTAEVRGAVNAGWRAWRTTATDLVARAYPAASADQVEVAARAVVIALAAVVRDYVAADLEEREFIRREIVPMMVTCCEAGLAAALD